VGLEGVLDVVEGEETPLTVDDDADGVEADPGGGGGWRRPGAQPFGGQPADPLALEWPDRVERAGRSGRAAGDARLDLAEDEATTVAGDDVDLAGSAAAAVALDQRVAGALEVGAGDVLAMGAETDTGIAGSHSRDARRGSVTAGGPV
jgi:hypothetical protein